MNTPLNEWANCPISLSSREIKEPFLVIDDFFSADDLPGHLEHLKKWRDRVIGNGYYTDLNGSPAGLLMNYQLTVRLVEASSILSKLVLTENMAEVNVDEVITDQKDLIKVKSLLNQSEMINPYSVLMGLFQEYNLGWYREQLQEWLSYALSRNPANEFVECPALVLVYETLQKLFAAALILLAVREDDDAGRGEKGISNSSNVRLYTLDNDIIPLHREVLPNFVSVIKSKLATVCAIYYLGRKPGNHESAFLLVLTADHEQGEALSISAMLEESCRPQNVTVLVHYASAVINAIDRGDHFFCRALSCLSLYVSGDLLLPDCNLYKPHFSLDLSEANWERWYKQGEEFLSGAGYYLAGQAYSAALFSLHQATECVLVALVRAVLGYKINSHNVLRLLRVTQFFTNDLTAIFQLETEEGQKIFMVLKDAYISVRYRDNYIADPACVDALYPLVSKLLLRAEQVHQQFLIRNTI